MKKIFWKPTLMVFAVNVGHRKICGVSGRSLTSGLYVHRRCLLRQCRVAKTMPRCGARTSRKKTLPEKQNGFPGAPFLSAAATYFSFLFILYFTWGQFSAPGGAVFRLPMDGFPACLEQQ